MLKTYIAAENGERFALYCNIPAVYGGYVLETGDYYYTVPGKECSQYWAEHVKKATLLRVGHPGWNQFAWGIPEDAELYDEIKLYGQPVSENA